MLNRLTPLVAIGALILSLTGCSEPAPKEEPAPVAKPAETVGPFYELTKEDLSAHPDFTSRNVMVLGAKIGDATTKVESSFGPIDKPLVVAGDLYITTYQSNAIGIYTIKQSGKIKRIELYDRFADKIADAKLKKLLKTGDLKLMRELFGMEEKMEEVTQNGSVEYVYDLRGIRFIEYKVTNSKIYSIRFGDIKK